jgi:hypothetical protein
LPLTEQAKEKFPNHDGRECRDPKISSSQKHSLYFATNMLSRQTQSRSGRIIPPNHETAWYDQHRKTWQVPGVSLSLDCNNHPSFYSKQLLRLLPKTAASFFTNSENANQTRPMRLETFSINALESPEASFPNRDFPSLPICDQPVSSLPTIIPAANVSSMSNLKKSQLPELDPACNAAESESTRPADRYP